MQQKKIHSQNKDSASEKMSVSFKFNSLFQQSQAPMRPSSFGFEESEFQQIFIHPQQSATLPIFSFMGGPSAFMPGIPPMPNQMFMDPGRVMLEKFNQRFNNLRQFPQPANFPHPLDMGNVSSQAQNKEKNFNADDLVKAESAKSKNIQNPGNDFNINKLFSKTNDNEDLENPIIKKKSNLNVNLQPEGPEFWAETDYSEIDGLNIQSRLVKLKNLNNLLIQIFCGSEINIEEYNIDELEEKILNSLLMRKFFKRFKDDTQRMTLEDKVIAINNIIKIKSAKRPEEFYKFVLTRVIKMLKRDFKAQDRSSVKIFNREFYDFYFKEVSIEFDIPIEQFYYPLTGKTCKKKEPINAGANLNSEYYEKIFKSSKFVNCMLSYLESLHSDYHREVIKKLEALLIKWDSELQDKRIDQKKIEKKIIDYLEKNKRCKLPWTLNEVDEAILRFKNHVVHTLASLKK